MRTIEISMTPEIEDALIQRNLTEMYVYNLAEVKRLRDSDDLETFRDDYEASLEAVDGVRKVMRHCLGENDYDKWIAEHGTEDDETEELKVEITENEDGSATAVLTAPSDVLNRLAQIGFLKALNDHIDRTLAELEGDDDAEI